MSPQSSRREKVSGRKLQACQPYIVVCQMLEAIVRDKVMEHLNANELLTDNQYGFWSKRSTSLQLLRVLDYWTQALDHNKNLDVVYLDYSKAFDTVPHV